MSLNGASIGEGVIGVASMALFHASRYLYDKYVQHPVIHGTIQAGFAIGSFVGGVLSKGLSRVNYLCSGVLSCKNLLLRHVVRPRIQKKYPNQNNAEKRKKIETKINSIATTVITGVVVGWQIGSRTSVAAGRGLCHFFNFLRREVPSAAPTVGLSDAVASIASTAKQVVNPTTVSSDAVQTAVPFGRRITKMIGSVFGRVMGFGHNKENY